MRFAKYTPCVRAVRRLVLWALPYPFLAARPSLQPPYTLAEPCLPTPFILAGLPLGPTKPAFIYSVRLLFAVTSLALSSPVITLSVCVL